MRRERATQGDDEAVAQTMLERSKGIRQRGCRCGQRADHVVNGSAYCAVHRPAERTRPAPRPAPARSGLGSGTTCCLCARPAKRLAVRGPRPVCAACATL